MPCRFLAVPLLSVLAACSAPSPVEPEFSASASDKPAPSAQEGGSVQGWPSARANPAGVYSWDGSSCAGTTSCIMGFMHNGFGSGNLRIEVDVRLNGATPSGAMPASVAGHDGSYRRIDALREEWIVDVGGATIAIRFTANPGTSQAELAEAYAIIGSMRTEAHDNPFGFRLIFTLATDDWDSG